MGVTQSDGFPDRTFKHPDLFQQLDKGQPSVTSNYGSNRPNLAGAPPSYDARESPLVAEMAENELSFYNVSSARKNTSSTTSKADASSPPSKLASEAVAAGAISLCALPGASEAGWREYTEPDGTRTVYVNDVTY